MPSLHAKVLKKNLIKTWRICRGDLVQVISGSEKGKKGLVVDVFRKKNRLTVEGVNLVQKHIKKTAESPAQVITKEAGIHYSNVLLVCPETQ
jgi:large subunit ribosomal protein L24